MKKKSVLVLLAATLMHAGAYATDLVQLSDREEVRRQENVKRGERLAEKAAQAVKDKNLKLAYIVYLEALKCIPSGSAAASNRQAVLEGFSKTAVDYAQNLLDRGNYDEAIKVAKTVLSQEINPDYKPAAQILSRLEKENYNTTLDPPFAAERDEVSKLLNQAEGFFATGRYDLAIKRYEQALILDPYNIAARRGMEMVNQKRNDYYKETYNETRSRMLWQVDRDWEKPVRQFNTDRSTEGASINNTEISSLSLKNKLDKITIDRIKLDKVSILEAVEIVKQKTRQYDTTTNDPAKKGINIVLKMPPESHPATQADDSGSQDETSGILAPNKNSFVTLDLKNIPLGVLLGYIGDLVGLKPKVGKYAVSLIPKNESADEMIRKEYRVSPSFFPLSESVDSLETPEPGRSNNSKYNQKLPGQRNAKAFLEEQGVLFPPDSWASFSLKDNTLAVFNTPSNIDLIDTLVETDVGTKPMQVEIESKFVEITQNNISELGFDWMLGPFSIGGGVFGDGGTLGGEGVNTDYFNNFPFGNIGGQPVTAGNRNGVGTGSRSAITANSLNALLAGVPQGANVASPGILGIAGVFTNPQFQMVIRALSQQKGVDLMSAPKVTTKSGNSATVKIVRGFYFPTEFDPPSVPDSENSGGGGGNSTSSVVLVSGMVTPATPTSFEVRDVGVILEVLPEVEPDNYTINLELAPEVVEFDGFINYGSPIIGPRYSNIFETLDNPSGIRTFTITENVMNQPVFSVRRIRTNVSVWDGQTVAMGGLIREDVQKVDDKVPFLGDIPLAGRLFRSSVDQKIKKNLIIFVTARLLDASGQPLIQDDEAEEIVEPRGVPENLPAPRLEARSAGK
jgi:general secretion pathway protein D